MSKQLQATLLIAAPPKRVWQALVDFPSRERHSKHVQQVDIVGDGAIKEGTKIKMKVDGRTYTSVVCELIDGEKLALKIAGPGMNIDHVYVLQPSGKDASLTITGTYTGVFGSVMGKLMPSSFQRGLEDELAAIKSAAEF